MSNGSTASFHSRFNRVLAVCVWILCLGAVLAVIVAGDLRNVSLVPVVALASLLAWVGLWRAAITVDDSVIEVRNAFSTVIVPWAALIQVDTKYALTLVTPHGSYTSTAAPAPSRLTLLLSRRDADAVQPDVAVGGRLRPGDIPSTDSGAAAIIVRRRWQQLRDEGRIELGAADRTPVLRHWHWTTIILSAVLLAAGVVTLATT